MLVDDVFSSLLRSGVGGVAAAKSSIDVLPNDLSQGPLDDGRACVDYMRACFRGYDDCLLDVANAFAPWSQLVERLDEDKVEIDAIFRSRSHRFSWDNALRGCPMIFEIPTTKQFLDNTARSSSGR